MIFSCFECFVKLSDFCIEIVFYKIYIKNITELLILKCSQDSNMSESLKNEKSFNFKYYSFSKKRIKFEN